MVDSKFANNALLTAKATLKPTFHTPFCMCNKRSCFWMSGIVFFPQATSIKIHGFQKGQAATTEGFLKTTQVQEKLVLAPAQWWTNMSKTKNTSKYRDFRHKTAPEGLLVDCLWNPPWGKAKVATMALDHLQPSSASRDKLYTVPSANRDYYEVRKLCQEGRLGEALGVVKLMVERSSEAPIAAYVCLLKGCAKRKALAEGKQVHALMVQSQCDSYIFLANNLIDMYSKCGSLLDAHKIFAAMPQRNVFSWTAIISAYADSGRCDEALNLFQEMQQNGIAADKVAYLVALKACARISAAEQGKQLYSEIVKTSFKSDVVIQNTLIDMFAKCGLLDEALKLFNNMGDGDLVSWNAMIQGYVQNGLGEEALALYEQMKQEGVLPNKITYAILLKACAKMAALQQGRQLHFEIRRRNFQSDVIVQSVLVDMYAKCGCLDDARRLFNMSKRDTVSWNTMIQGYIQNGLFPEALELYEQMKHEDVQPDKVTYMLTLKACSSMSSKDQGKQLQTEIRERGFESDLTIQSTLIDMYAKCGCLDDARELFDNMSMRDVVSWNAMMHGYVQNGIGEEALALYEKMLRGGVHPDKVTFTVALKACSRIGALEQGKQLHLEIKKRGLESDAMLQSTLVDMYARCGCLDKACELFNNMNQRDVVAWNVMMQGYVQNNLGTEALALYQEMKQDGVQSDKVTFVVLLKACASIAALEQGKQLHSEIRKRGLGSDVTLQSTLIDMYAKCGRLGDARVVFTNMTERSVVSWNAMIQGYVQNNLGKEALALYEKMKQEGVQPSIVTFIVALRACASIVDLQQGKQIHFLIQNRGLDSNVMIQNTLVDMYAKCGSLDDAHELFKNIREPNVVSWSALIQGHVQNGLEKEALDLYEQMKQEGVEPDKVTYVVLLRACANSGALEQGNQFHLEIRRRGFGSDVMVQNSLVHMYAKCGRADDASELFMNMSERSIVSWNAMIQGFVQNGCGEDAIALYRKMKQEGLQPDKVTYISLLSACSHSGLVDEGHHIFDSMCKDHGVSPTLEHYACMVDLLGRVRISD